MMAIGGVSAQGTSAYSGLFNEIDRLTPSVEGVSALVLSDLEKKLELSGPGKEVIYDNAARMPNVESKYSLLRFENVAFGEITAGKLIVEVDHSAAPVVQRLSFDLSHPSCVDSAPIILKYGLNRSALPDAGSEASEVRYERHIGLGTIWLNAKPVRSPHEISCATTMGLVFGSRDEK
jgi:hypothetical protein